MSGGSGAVFAGERYRSARRRKRWGLRWRRERGCRRDINRLQRPCIRWRVRLAAKVAARRAGLALRNQPAPGRECDVDRQDRKRRAGSSAVDRGRIERQGAIDRSDELFLRQGPVNGRRAGRRHRDDERHRAGRRLGSGLRQSGPDGLRLLDRPSRQGLFRNPDRWRARCRRRPLGAARRGVRHSSRGGQLRHRWRRRPPAARPRRSISATAAI